MNPRELARGMGFPETYELPASRREASLLIGNAISVDVASGVIEQIAA